MARDSGEPKRAIPEEAIRLRGDHPNRFPWPPRLAALLGKISDTAVARRAGLTRRAAQAERRRRGIPPIVKPQSPIRWTPQMVRMLGRAPDAAVARELGINPWTVMAKRKCLGIAPHGPVSRPALITWTKKSIWLLWTLSDTEAAGALGISRSTVKLKRRELGIPDGGGRPVKWTPAMKSLLGNLSDPAAAKRLGISRATVSRRRTELGIPPKGTRRFPLVRGPKLRKLLQTMSAEELNRGYGMRHDTVRKLREEMKVPAPPPRSRKGIPQHRWSPRERALLGKLPDEAVAARVGVRSAAGKTKRKRLGIRALLGRNGSRPRGRVD